MRCSSRAAATATTRPYRAARLREPGYTHATLLEIVVTGCDGRAVDLDTLCQRGNNVARFVIGPGFIPTVCSLRLGLLTDGAEQSRSEAKKPLSRKNLGGDSRVSELRQHRHTLK